MTAISAEPAYGKRATSRTQVEELWKAGKDFRAKEMPAGWIGGAYFSIRNVKTINALGVTKLIVPIYQRPDQSPVTFCFVNIEQPR